MKEEARDIEAIKKTRERRRNIANIVLIKKRNQGTSTEINIKKAITTLNMKSNS
ncbi:hypothetical protein Patl1_20846 [Pistacia atlantica]|uniref:Uncharacterized protein n=1 Tax=Pistacia atlantica TaxID=434234 RepID=A0ACC1BIY4_9ROSI|nr:hypothetical protein Patl1_20846 [Pistacia atlantica]